MGVARQYSGTLGKIGNGQIAVTCCYSDPQVSWPVAIRLYVPQTWAYDPARRQQARVPPEIAFQTTPEIALQLLDQARAWGVPYRCVVVDADDGDHPNCLAGLKAQQERYVVAVRRDFAVSVGRAATSPVWRADERLHSASRGQWRTVRWRRGTKRWLHKTCVAVHGWRVTSTGHRHKGWPVGERAPQGQAEERTYYWSNMPTEAPLAELAGLAHRRHAIEQFHEEATGELAGIRTRAACGRGFIAMP